MNIVFSIWLPLSASLGPLAGNQSHMTCPQGAVATTMLRPDNGSLTCPFASSESLLTTV